MSDDFDLKAIFHYLKPRNVVIWISVVVYAIFAIAGAIFFVVQLWNLS